MPTAREVSAARFVAVEGIDGSGKSTLATRLLSRLESAGARPVLASRLHAVAATDGYVRDHLRALHRLVWEYPEDARTSDLGFRHWAHLLASWFAAVDHTVVRPALADGRWVVADSWHHKFVARFAVRVGLAEAERFFAGITRPDRVVWLDVPPEVCASRRHDQRTTERGEWVGLDGFVAYQREVRAAYGALAGSDGSDGWHVVTGGDPDAVADGVLDWLAER